MKSLTAETLSLGDNAPRPISRRLSRVARPWWLRLAGRLVAVSPGRVLHLGADDACLVEALLEHGLEVDGCTDAEIPGSPCAPRRFRRESELGTCAVPGHYATVVWSAPAFASPGGTASDPAVVLARLAPRHVFLLLDQHEGAIALSTRQQIAGRMFARGFHRHPATSLFQAYDERAEDPRVLILAFERRPVGRADGAEVERDPLVSVSPEAEALAARYALAARLVYTRDAVLDLAGAAGAGAAILHDASRCDQVLALMDKADAVAYAQAVYGTTRPRLSFSSAFNGLASCADNSADVIVAVDVGASQRDDIAEVVQEARRVLIPSGRLILAAPVDETPALTTRRLEDAVGPGFRVEAFYVQQSRVDIQGVIERRLESVDFDQPTDNADTWILSLVKDPIAHERPHPSATNHPGAGSLGHPLSADTLGYRNPWTARALIAPERRSASSALLNEFALRTIEHASGYRSEAGAALCVLGYRKLEDSWTELSHVPLEQWLDAYVRDTPCGDLETRWQVSNAFVLGLLHVKAGDLVAAEGAFARCASLEVPETFPTLAVKSVGAALKSGWLAHARGALPEARRHWQRGLDLARQAIRDRWDTYLGTSDALPKPWGPHEASQILALASDCTSALIWLDSPDEPRRQPLGGMGVRPGGITLPPTHTASSVAVEPANLLTAIPRRQQPVRNRSWRRPVFLVTDDGEMVAHLLSGAHARPVYLWGAGALGRRFAEQAGPAFGRVTGIIDRDPTKAGQQLAGRPIVSPEQIAGAASLQPRPFVIITSQFEAEIRSWLQQQGYEESEDVFTFTGN